MNQEKTIWYFAFGSNMNPKILTDLRKVKPILSKPGFAPGWYLNFDSPGLPYVEPCFASIGRKSVISSVGSPQPNVHGVLHEITVSDYEIIRKTELGGGHDGIGYSSMEITVLTYDGEEHLASTLIECPRTVFHGQFYPSKRYMELIEGGAEMYGLKESYQNWLKTVPRYIQDGSLRQRIGKTLFMAIVFLCSVPLLCPHYTRVFFHTSGPRWTNATSAWFMNLLAHVYYFVFFPIFGPGAGEPIVAKKNN